VGAVKKINQKDSLLYRNKKSVNEKDLRDIVRREKRADPSPRQTKKVED
jgi:hypothetical protein